MINIITPDMNKVKVQGKAILLAKNLDNTITFNLITNDIVDATQYQFAIIFTEEDYKWLQQTQLI